jgi:hypothetical protein
VNPVGKKRRKKGGRTPLTRGKPRLLGRHDGWQGQEYARAYAAAEDDLGPFTSRLLRMEAGRMAAAWVRLVAAQRALAASRRERERGKGRRPGGREIERLSRRAGLEDASYSQAGDKLRELAAQNGKPAALERYLAEKYGGGQSRGGDGT